MKKHLIFACLLLNVVSTLLYAQQSDMKTEVNPFLRDWKTPFQAPPFSDIKQEHFLPAFEEALNRHREEIAAITKNSEPPTFDNTIGAFEKSGRLLAKVSDVFFNLKRTMNDSGMEEIAKKVTPLVTRHRDDIRLDEKLFARVKAIYEGRAALTLTTEQRTVLENAYLDFVLGGVGLDSDGKKRVRKINEELAMLSLAFSENVLKENSSFQFFVTDQDQLAGMQPASIEAAKEKAGKQGRSGAWLFTIDKPSLIPVLQYADNRELREKLYTAYMNRGNNDDERDNKKNLARIIALRVERAQLLGFDTHAELALKRTMAKTPQRVYDFLRQVWTPAYARAKAEIAEMQKLIDAEGKQFKLAPWDWWYYAEKVKKEKYDLDESMLRPYFNLDNVMTGVFTVARKLYGLKINERHDIPVYHSDVRVFEVKEETGAHVGILFTDYFPRAGKRNGAWCDGFRSQMRLDGKTVTPLVINAGNFSKPTATQPALLSLDETRTLFHEFGHALHALLSNVTYPSAQTMPYDFVELPSQVMENWSLEPEVLQLYARHYETNRLMPKDLIDRVVKARHFNQGFETLEYIAAALLDMDWHTLTDTKPRDVATFERESIRRMGLMPEMLPRYLSTNFLHITSGGYDAGYYSYLWAQVLDSDAFDLFLENGLFDKRTATSFRKNILEKLGSDDFMSMYKSFRGREPKVDALLKKRGLKE